MKLRALIVCSIIALTAFFSPPALGQGQDVEEALKMQIELQKRLLEMMQKEKKKEVFEPLKEITPFEEVKLEKPVFGSMRTLERRGIRGNIIAISGDTFTIEVNKKKDDVQTIDWSTIEPKSAALVYKRIMLQVGSAERWAYFATMLYSRRDEKLAMKYSVEAIEKAWELIENDSDADAEIDRIEEENKKNKEAWEKYQEEQKNKPKEKKKKKNKKNNKKDKTEEKPEVKEPEVKPYVRQYALKTKIQKAMEIYKVALVEAENPVWGILTKEEHLAAVERMKEYGTAAQEKVSQDIKLYETDYFLLYSDLPTAQAKRWQKLMDRMYNHLCRMFDIKKGTNIWHGKCVMFIMSSEHMYVKVESEVMGLNPMWVRGTLGLCHSYPDGRVVISLYMLEDESEFAHVLVHEATHGFIHRYRSDKRVISWANEGLAEVVAEQLSGAKMLKEGTKISLDWVRYYKSLSGYTPFFDATHIAGWQYGVAGDFTKFLMNASKKRYVKFFNLMKDGMDSRDALRKAYGVDYRVLVRKYGESVGIKDLKP